ncbi:MAG: BamA/TamA family outer membrane protein [Candidatus Omnitrophica bacterium]|nr:BamA/TamA family outer membrane protein [Candidatus Omnitrophota bacterium]
MKEITRITLFVLFFVISFLFSSSQNIFAQNPPPGQEPGAQVERYKYDVEKEKKRLEYKKPKAPKLEVEKEKAKPVSEGPSFILKEVNVIGSTIFKPQDFKAIYELYLNKNVTFQDMDIVSKKIESKYKEKGYFTTTVYIPEQEIKDGIIEIRIAEGKMGQLNVEGNKWFSADFIKKFIHVKKNEILNINTLARDILRINKNPDLEIRSVISQGKDPLTSDISLKVGGKSPWHTGILEDNRGSRLTGKYRSMFFIRGSNVSGSGDTIFVNTLNSGKSFAESVSCSIPIGTYGTKFGIDATYFGMKLGEEYKSFDITGNTQIYSPHFSWELALREDFDAYADLGIDIKSIKKKMGGDTTANDQLRTPYFAFELSKIDSGGQTTFSPRFDFGTSGFLGASSRNHPTSSRAGTGGVFFKYGQSLNRIQKMVLDSYMSIRTQLQIASHTLASSEQFQLGGADSVRGYPEGDYLADTGGVLNFDWVFPMYIIPKTWKLPGQETPLRHQIEPVFFVDVGGGKLKKVLPGESKDKSLAGVGGGLRLHFKFFSLRLDWAKAIGDKQTSGSGPSTFYFTFQSEI